MRRGLLKAGAGFFLVNVPFFFGPNLHVVKDAQNHGVLAQVRVISEHLRNKDAALRVHLDFGSGREQRALESPLFHLIGQRKLVELGGQALPGLGRIQKQALLQALRHDEMAAGIFVPEARGQEQTTFVVDPVAVLAEKNRNSTFPHFSPLRTSIPPAETSVKTASKKILPDFSRRIGIESCILYTEFCSSDNPFKTRVPFGTGRPRRAPFFYAMSWSRRGGPPLLQSAL